MTSHEKGRPLPKFGEWDVNNPASADGFTVIFAKARDEKKAKGTAASAELQPRAAANMYLIIKTNLTITPARKVGFAASEKLMHFGAVKWETCA